MNSKVMTLSEAIKKYVKHGQKIYIGGFTHSVPFSAVHEIIRQGIKDLEVCKMVPELVLDQLIAAESCRKVIFGWGGNPGLGNLRMFRNSYEKGIPYKIDIEEYSHFGLLLRLYAGAAGLPFMMYRSNFGSDLPKFNRHIKTVECPYTGEMLSTVPAYNADVAILHAQRADIKGNVNMWGILGEQKEAAFGAKKVIVTVEEIVDSNIIRAHPNLTVLPSIVVDAVVKEPWGAHPAYVQGYYDRDNDFYINWNNASREENYVNEYLNEWVYRLESRKEYFEKNGGFQHLRMVHRDETY